MYTVYHYIIYMILYLYIYVLLNDDVGWCRFPSSNFDLPSLFIDMLIKYHRPHTYIYTYQCECSLIGVWCSNHFGFRAIICPVGLPNPCHFQTEKRGPGSKCQDESPYLAVVTRYTHESLIQTDEGPPSKTM